MALAVVYMTVVACVSLVNGQDDVLVFSLTEESPAFTFIGNIALSAALADAYPADVLESMEFGFLPQPNQDASFFEMDKSNGIIRTSSKKLDRESVCSGTNEECSVEIDVAIVKPIEYLHVFTARMEILDINDNAPMFQRDQIEVKFSESSQVGSTVSLPLPMDLDSLRFSVKRYELRQGSESHFELITTEVNSLKLQLKTSIDREETESYDIQVVAFDGGNPSLSGSLAVHVVIEDANDHPPMFASEEYTVNVHEDYALNTSIIQVQAQDADTGVFGQVKYSFSPLTASLYGGIFEVNEQNGDVVLQKALDYEKTKKYSLDILATDGGMDSQAAQTSVVINILDVNDNAPQITINTLAMTEAVISEMAAIDTFVAHVSIFDADEGENGKTTCSLNHDAFSFQPLPNNRFKLVTAKALDREVTEEYLLTIECEDKGVPSLSAKKDLRVLVKDENDHAPVLSQQVYTASIMENSPAGTSILKINATDRDTGDNAKIVFEKSSGVVSKFVAIDPETGVITAAVKLDYESVKEITFEVVAKDSGNPVRSSVAMVTLTILDQNDNAPVFTQSRYSFSVKERELSGTQVDFVTAVDLDSTEFNAFTYVIQDSEDAMFFSINPNTGEVTTRGQLDRETSASHHLTVHAVDTLDKSLVRTTFVDIMVEDLNDNYPQIHYPTGDNNTLYISSNVPIGYTILRVQASDADIGKNANLSYMLLDNPDQAFIIDPVAGILETNRDFTTIDVQEFEFTVLVKDHGDPAKANTTNVKIIVDSAISYAAPGQAGIVRQNNLTIIIAVATVSGLIMVVLIIAIVLLKTVDRRKEPMDKYMVDIETASDIANHVESQGNKKEVSFIIDTAEERNKQVAPMSYEASGPSSAHLNSSYEGRPNNKQLEAHYLGLGSHDHADNASSSSAELSTADSGRGASEEGRDSHSPPPAIPPRASTSSSNNPQRPQRNNSSAAAATRPPPSYNTYIRNSGRRQSNPKPPCKLHHPQQQNNNPRRPNSAVQFGDRPRDSYYGNRDHDTASLQYSVQDLPDPIQIVKERNPRTDRLIHKAVIV